MKCENDKLKLKVKLFHNENRRLKRKLEPCISESDTEATESSSSNSVDRTILSLVSPASKKRAKHRIKLTTPPMGKVKRAIRLDKLTPPSMPGRKNNLQEKIEKFIFQDENSICVPDKKKNNMRYRLATLEMLWEKFLSEEKEDCSYAQFTRYVPHNVIKPKPEDWGTCFYA